MSSILNHPVVRGWKRNRGAHAPRSPMAWLLVNTDRRRRSEFVERPRAADAVPRVFVVRLLAFTFVAFHEAGDEQLFRHRVEFDSAGAAVGDDLVVVLEFDGLDHGSR